MIQRQISISSMKEFEIYLDEDEKSRATIEKYMRDIRYFESFAKGENIDKALVLAYKTFLEQKYAVTSANSMLAALNAFFRFLGWQELCVKQFRVQKQVYCSEEKELTREEYMRLIQVARKKDNERLALIIQTICATGIRVSELAYITVDAVKRGECNVSCKGKTRTVFIVKKLQKQLLQYMSTQKIVVGCVFVTRSGKALDRSNIWREMKLLCEEAGVSKEKVFPHNLRHLFARTFYSIEKDIAKLADILGHSNMNTTRIYIMTTGAEHRRKMERMRLII